MTSSENMPSIEPWLHRTTPFADSRLSDAFARDTESPTRALPQSPSPTAIARSFRSRPTCPPEPFPPRRRSGIHAAAGAGKRRSRAAKRAATTFITADAANFRQMVQEVTGLRFSGGGCPVATVKPELQREVWRGHGGLPNLDTLLEPVCSLQCDVSADGAGGFDFESFSCFPTLESGKLCTDCI